MPRAHWRTACSLWALKVSACGRPRTVSNSQLRILAPGFPLSMNQGLLTLPGNSQSAEIVFHSRSPASQRIPFSRRPAPLWYWLWYFWEKRCPRYSSFWIIFKEVLPRLTSWRGSEAEVAILRIADLGLELFLDVEVKVKDRCLGWRQGSTEPHWPQMALSSASRPEIGRRIQPNPEVSGFGLGLLLTCLVIAHGRPWSQIPDRIG